MMRDLWYSKYTPYCLCIFVAGNHSFLDKFDLTLLLIVYLRNGWVEWAEPLACLSPFSVKLLDKESYYFDLVFFTSLDFQDFPNKVRNKSLSLFFQ